MPCAPLSEHRNIPGFNETLEIEVLREQVCGDFQEISSAIMSATASAAAAVQTRDPTMPQEYPPCTASTPKFSGYRFNIKGDILTER